MMLVFHADVHVFGMRQKILEFGGEEVQEDGSESENYQQPHKPVVTKNKVECSLHISVFCVNDDNSLNCGN